MRKALPWIFLLIAFLLIRANFGSMAGFIIAGIVLIFILKRQKSKHTPERRPRPAPGDNNPQSRTPDEELSNLKTKVKDAPGRIPKWVQDKIKAGKHPVTALRTWRNMSLQDLAQACGVNESHIADIESGEIPLGPFDRQQISQALDVAPSDLSRDKTI